MPDAVEKGIGWVDRELQGSVNLTVHLDLRNTDAAFGGPIGDLWPAIRTTGSSGRRCCGRGRAQAGAPLALSGVVVAARQKTLQIGDFGITTRFPGTTDANGTAHMSVTKGKATGICLDLENDAATVNDYFTRMEICSFEKGETTAAGKVTTARSYTSDTTLDVELQNKYLNVLAQLTDGSAYLNDVAHYAAHKASVLAGPMANALSPLTKGRAVTPCLGLPDGALDLVDGGLIKAASRHPAARGRGVGGRDSPRRRRRCSRSTSPSDDGENLTSRGVASHEYGHFAMCSMLADEDKTKMIEIPSLLIQRIIEGSYMDVGDEATRVMEAWADFFAGQTAGGYDDFSLENGAADPQGVMGYCDGTRDATTGGACWDWNYVEDVTARPNPNAPFEDIGTPLQMRRVATTLFDASAWPPRGGDDPGQGDFWHLDPTTHLFAVASAHRGDAHDESIALPGAAMRTLIHNWTHATWPLGWQVTEQQLFGALNATIRGTPKDVSRPLDTYGWCDACALFALHAATFQPRLRVDGERRRCERRRSHVAVGFYHGRSSSRAVRRRPRAASWACRWRARSGSLTCTFAGCSRAADDLAALRPEDPTAACAACADCRQISVDGRRMRRTAPMPRSSEARTATRASPAPRCRSPTRSGPRVSLAAIDKSPLARRASPARSPKSRRPMEPASFARRQARSTANCTVHYENQRLYVRRDLLPLHIDGERRACRHRRVKLSAVDLASAAAPVPRTSDQPDGDERREQRWVCRARSSMSPALTAQPPLCFAGGHSSRSPPPGAHRGARHCCSRHAVPAPAVPSTAAARRAA